MTNVIILAAGEITTKIKFLKAVYRSPALLPINTKPVMLYLLDFYSRFSDLKVHLVINQEDEATIFGELNTLDFSFQIVPINFSKNVNETLKIALESIIPTENTIVNIVTTIPDILPDENHVLIDENLSSNRHWSVINADIETNVGYHSKDSEATIGNAFTGVFNINSIMLLNSVNKSLSSNDLLTTIKNLDKSPKFDKSIWIDCGHELNYYDAKLKLISSRSFNMISVGGYGILKKGSKNYKKLFDEYNFINSLPSQLSLLFPRLLGKYEFDTTSDTGTYEMEFYGYPSLSELQLFWDLDEEVWERIFADVFKVISDFKKERYSIGFKAYKEFIVSKLNDRVIDFRNSIDSDFLQLMDSRCVINGLKCQTYDSLKSHLYDRLEALYTEDDFCISHGDLCFNNMLYDVNHRMIKLIDPRGSFGETCKGLFGDIKYDLAKFLHSSVGHYDYIVNNLYSLEIADTNITYSFHLRGNQSILEDKSLKLLSLLGYNHKDLMLLVSTLFLSMTPLHDDSRSRQKIMYLHGLYLLNKYL